RFIPRNRSHHGGRGLDRDRLRFPPRSPFVTSAFAGLIAPPCRLSSRARRLVERLRPVGEEKSMRWLYLAVIVLFAAATLVFALQNFEIVTVSFLGFKLRARASDDCRLRPRRGDG